MPRLAKNEAGAGLEPSGPKLHPSHAWPAILLGMLAFALYAFSAASTAYPLDSAELAAAAFGLGVAHPPGEETTLLVASLCTMLPLGSVAFKVALSQAAAGAVAVGLVYLLVVEATVDLVGREDGLGELARGLVAGIAALLFAWAPGVLIVSHRPEVYALQTALSLGAIYAALLARRRRDPRLVLLAALLVGLGIGNHSLVAGLVAIAAVIAAAPLLRAAPDEIEDRRSGRRTRHRLVGLSLAAFGAGALVHAYLPLRTAALFASPDQGMNGVLWGDARTLAGLWWMLSAKTFTDKTTVVHGNASPGDLPFLPAEELGGAFALLALLGAYVLLRRRESRLLAVVLLVGAAGSMAAGLAGGLDPSNPDIRGYLGPALAITAVLAGAAMATVLSVVRISQVRTIAIGLAAIAALLRWPSPSIYPGLRHASAADFAVRDTLAGLPARAALFTFHFETGFLVAYQRLVEGARPDVDWAHLAFAAGPGYAPRAAAALPELAPVVEAYRRRSGLAEAWSRLNEQRPVRIEADVSTPLAVRRTLGPAGDLWAPAKSTTPEAPTRLPTWTHQEAKRDRQIRGYLAWRSYIDADWSCELGFVERARERFAELELLVPGDERFRDLERRCH